MPLLFILTNFYFICWIKQQKDVNNHIENIYIFWFMGYILYWPDQILTCKNQEADLGCVRHRVPVASRQGKFPTANASQDLFWCVVRAVSEGRETVGQNECWVCERTCECALTEKGWEEKEKSGFYFCNTPISTVLFLANTYG